MAAYQRSNGPTPEDTRGASRNRTLLGGKIVSSDGAYSVDCTIRDISASGARIGIPGATVLSKEFFLLDLKHGKAFVSEVTWRNASQTGVKFHDVIDLTDNVNPRFRFLRNLYVESRLR